MYQTINIHVGHVEGQPDKKAEVKAAALAHGMSVSKFMMYCFDKVNDQKGESDGRQKVRRRTDH